MHQAGYNTQRTILRTTSSTSRCASPVGACLFSCLGRGVSGHRRSTGSLTLDDACRHALCTRARRDPSLHTVHTGPRAAWHRTVPHSSQRPLAVSHRAVASAHSAWLTRHYRVTHHKRLVTDRALLRFRKCFQALPVPDVNQGFQLEPPPSIGQSHKPQRRTSCQALSSHYESCRRACRTR